MSTDITQNPEETPNLRSRSLFRTVPTSGSTPIRCWINQPSTLQPHHSLHGTNVLYIPNTQTVYFTSGDVHSMRLDPLYLSLGWKDVSNV